MEAAPPTPVVVRPQVPHVHRKLQKATRELTADAVEAARRRRQLEGAVLAQIHARAVRIRELARKHGKTPLGKPLEFGDEDDAVMMGDAPMTLVELIQASGPVFVKHGIKAPDDAMFHRHLLTLSMDPEKDWKKKIEMFVMKQQPKVKRLCTEGDGRRESMGRKTEANAQVGDRRRVMEEVGKKERRESMRRIEKPDQVRAVSFESAPDGVHKAEGRREKKTPDRFGDLLLASKWYVPLDTKVLKENQVRNATFIGGESTKHDKAARQPNGGLIKVAYRLSDANNTDADDQRERTEIALHQVASDDNPEAFRSPTPNFHLMAITFQQWRELTALQRLVREGRQREIRLAQTILPPVATHSIFKWISASLPGPNLRVSDKFIDSSVIPAFVLASGLEIRELSSLQRFSDRYVKWIALRGLLSWAAHAQASKSMRIKSLIRNRTREWEVAFECLHEWHKIARTRKRTECHAVWVESVRARRLLRRHWSAWKTEMEVRRSEHNADHLYQRILLQNLLVSWMTFVTRKRDARIMGSRRTRRRVFRHWMQVTSVEREMQRLQGDLATSLRKRVIAKVWEAWRAWAKLSHRQRHFAVVSRRKALLATAKLLVTRWRHYAHAMVGLYHKYQRFKKWRYNRLKLRIIQEWRVYSQQRRNWEEYVNTFIAQRNRRTLKSAWEAMRSSYHISVVYDAAHLQAWERLNLSVLWSRWKRLAGIMVVAKQLRTACESDSRRDTLRKWKRFVRESQNLRQLTCEWRMRRHMKAKRHVFDTLVKARMQGQVRRQTVQAFSKQRQKSHLQRCVNNWQAYSKSRRLQQHKEKEVNAAWRIVELREPWNLWRRGFYIEDSINRAEISTRKRLVRGCFSQLKSRLARARLQEQRNKTVNNFKLRRSLMQWQRALVSKAMTQQCSNAVKSLKRGRLMVLAWQEWRRLLAESRIKHQQIAYAVSRWKNRQLRVFFLEWGCTIRKRKRYQQIVISWQETAKEKRLSLQWQAWIQYVAHQQHKRNNIFVGEAHHIRWSLNQAITRWKHLSVKSRFRIALLCRCVDQWAHCSKRRVLVRWQAFIRVRKLSRYAVGRLHGKLLQQCFVRWKQWRQDRLITRLRTSCSVGGLRRWQLSRAMKRLRFHATVGKRLRYFQMIIKSAGTRGMVLTTFRLWKQFVMLCRKDQSRDTARRSHMTAFRVQRFIQQWVRFVHVRKLIKATLVQVTALSATNRLRNVLQAWKKFVCQRQFVAALNEKAVVFRVFSLLPSCFNAWVRHTRTQSRKREILLYTAGLIRHRLESRAYNAWREFTVVAKLTRRAVRIWQNEAMMKSFSRWKLYKTMVGQEQTAIRYNATRTQKRVLQEWHGTVYRIRLLKHCAQLWRTRSSRACFDRWTRHVKVIKAARSMMTRLKNTTMSRIFNSWRSIIQDHVQVAARIRGRFLLMWNQDRTMTSFQRWKLSATRQRQLKRQIANHLQRCSNRCFSWWKCSVIKRKRLNSAAQQVQRRHNLSLLRTSYVQWRHEQSTRDAMTKIRHRFAQSSASCLMKLAFIDWRSYVSRRRRIKSACLSRNLTVISSAFSRWKIDYMHKCRKERTLVSQLRTQHDNMLKRRVLTKMRSRMHLKAVCTSVFLPHWQQYVLCQVWAAWVRHHISKQDRKRRIFELQRQLKRSGPSTAELATLCLRRWYRLNASKVFIAWASTADERKWLRENTAIALQLWQSRQVAQRFYSWLQQVEKQKRKRAIFGMYRKNRQRRVWQSLVAFTRRQKRLVLHEAFVSRSRTRKCQAAILQEWRRLVSKKHHESLVQAAIALRRTRGAVREWHTFAVARRADRMRLTVATVAYQHNVYTRIWQEWREYVGLVRFHRQELQQNTQRLQILILCSIFRAWRAWSHRERTLRRVGSLLAGQLDTQLVNTFFRAWATFACNKANATRLADQFYFTRRAQVAVTCFRVFVSHKKAQVVAIEKGRKWVEVLGGRCLASSFRLWKQFTFLQKQSRRVVHRYHTQILLPRIWRAWKEYLSLRQAKGARLERAVRCWRSSFVRRAWNAWALYKLGQLMKREATIKAIQHFAFTLCRSLILKWRAVVVKKRLLGATCHKLIVRWKLQSSYKYFTAWQNFTLTKKTSRLNAIAVASGSTTTLARYVWAEWRRQFIVLKVCKRKQMRRIWDRWASSVEQTHAWEAFQDDQREALMRTVHIPRAIRRWRAFVVEGKLAKAMSLLSSRFSRDNLVKKCFENWLAFLILRQKEKELMMHVLKWMHNRNLLRAFHSLSAYAERQQRKRLMMDQALRHSHHVLKRTRFYGWRRVVTTLKRQREKLQQYVSLMQTVSQRKSFAAWRDFATRRKRVRATCTTILSQRAMLTTRRVMDEWISFTCKEKQRRRADEHYTGQVYHRLWQRWKRFLILTRIERMLGASEQRLVETSFVEWRKRAILNKNVRLRGTEKRQRDAMATVKQCFTMWHQWSRIRSKCTMILANVAVSNHRRLRFMLWKAFTVQRTKLKRLICGESMQQGPLSSTCEISSDASSIEPPSVRIARIARVLQRFVLDWDDLSTPWQRWRNAFHASLFHRMRAMYRCFAAWSAWSQRRQYIQRTLRRQHSARQIRLLQSTLHTWRHIVVMVKRIQYERRREREMLVIVNAQILRLERKSLQTHWSAWRQLVEEKHHLITSLLAYQRARVLTKFWLIWSHDFVSIMKQKHTQYMAKRYEINTFKTRRAIQAWIGHRHWKQRTRQAVNIMTHNRHSRLRARVFKQWVGFYALRSGVNGLIGKRRVRILEAVMATWRTWKAEKQKQHVEIEAFMDHRDTRMRQLTWHRWLTFVCQRRRCDALNTSAVEFLVRRCVRQRWLRFTRTRRMSRELRKRAEAALVVWKKQRVVSFWHATSYHARLERLRRGILLRKYMTQWVSHTREAIAIRFESFQRRKHLRLVLRKWHEYSQRRCILHAVETEVMKAQRLNKLARVWRFWLQFVALRHKKRAADDHFIRELKLKWLLHWFDAARALQLNRDARMEMAVAHYEYHTKHATVMMWKHGVKKQRQHHAVLMACMVKLTRAVHRRMVQVVLHEWAAVVDSSRFTYECAERLLHRRLQRSIAQWRRRLAEWRRIDELHRDAVVYYRRRLLSAPFFHWQNYALAWKDAEQNGHRKPTAVTPLPRRVQIPISHPSALQVDEDDEADQPVYRRPLSPMTKRMREKKQKLLQETINDADLESAFSPPLPPLSDAAALSLDVKKRLLVLGKWKPSQRSLSQ